MIKAIPQLNKILNEKGLSQLAFANQNNIPQTVVNRFDKSVQHKSEYLFIISRALKITIEELFEVTEN